MTSRLPGFHRESIAARRQVLASSLGVSAADLALLDAGGLAVEAADRLIENAVGLFGLPFGLGVNLLVNGRDVLIPMVTEEASVVAGLSNGARLARAGGGVVAEADQPLMLGQIQVLGVPDSAAALAALEQRRDEIMAVADQPHRSIVALGGGARRLEARTVASPVGEMLIVGLQMDVRDAMGANAVNTSMEAIAPLIAELTGGRVVVRVLSNLADARLARASCRVPFDALAFDEWPGNLVAQRIVEAGAFALVDVHRAATHNKGIMNGIDAVGLATGNDWRSIEAGAHAYAARSGVYQPLSTWRIEEHMLAGHIELPLAVGIVGGATQRHPLAALSLRLIGASSATELAEVMAAVGLAQNLAALRALATEGIQQGHMRLHLRHVQCATPC
jgi:hydroxymethylglutaryl-CoA reductase